MLATTLEFRQVFPRFSACDANYLWLSEVEDWRRAEEVCKFLKIFQEVIDSISGTKYPLANMFLPEVWKIKEALNEKSREENSYMRAMAMKMKEKFDKYWGECNQLMAIAAVLDPRYKMTFIKFSFPKMYNEVESKKNIELVSGSLLEVYKEYVLNHALHCLSVTKEMNIVGGSSSTTTTTYKAKGKTKYDLYVRSMENVMPIKSDLETYLEGVYICEVNCESQFDVIRWWKANNLKYKILSTMTVNILSIPITTVASEATFSTSGRVIDPYRASLSTKTMEALICGGDWIRSLYGVKQVYTDKIKEETVNFVVIAWEIPLSRLFLGV
ncbi:hypothetical protein RJ639_028773 [Escallonia herrerae]|uniref:Uncharacterized protein n=1 Tax=Escallonia herrerae TaxID=1293975 RepID=A0AA88X5W9_9ASTE|nr:hypothetical protein RJ639_028773 [Escallonia herrerae]